MYYDPTQRFWSKVKRGPKCWLWQAGTARGYGRFSFQGRDIQATHFVWKLRRGPIPKGKIIMHTCDVKRCVRLAHLKLGTKRENLLDCIAKGLYRGRGPAREYL